MKYPSMVLVVWQRKNGVTINWVERFRTGEARGVVKFSGDVEWPLCI